MTKPTSYYELVVSQLVKEDGKTKEWKVTSIIADIEEKKCFEIAKLFNRTTSSRLHFAALYPGSYSIGSVWHSK